VRKIKFLSPEITQRRRTWTIAGSKGNPGAAEQMLLNSDGRNSGVPGGGSVSIIL